MLSRLTLDGLSGQFVLGLLLGIFILTALDKKFEAWVRDVAPAWLTQVGTSL